jgi:hypothetical protein
MTGIGTNISNSKDNEAMTKQDLQRFNSLQYELITKSVHEPTKPFDVQLSLPTWLAPLCSKNLFS